jgi:acyl-CoA thioesterase
MHSFDAAIQLTPLGNGRFAGATSPGYGNMVGPFGGITNALMLNAPMQHPERRGEPVVLTVNFAGPVRDGAFEIEARPVRTNRSTQHWSMELRQGGQVQTTGTAVFAQRREGWSAVEAVAPTELPPPGAVPPLPAEGLPAWVRCYDMRFIDGGLDALDGRERSDSSSRLWVRDDPPRALSFQSLAAICDCFFPQVFLRLGRILPAGTVSMTTYFHADESLLRAQADRHVLGIARALNFRNGYSDQTAEIWSDARELLASTQQMVYFRG